jgi:hypothetical protein
MENQISPIELRMFQIQIERFRGKSKPEIPDASVHKSELGFRSFFVGIVLEIDVAIRF